MSDEPIKRMTVRLPASLHKQLKLRSVEIDKTMESIIIDLVNEYLKKNGFFFKLQKDK